MSSEATAERSPAISRRRFLGALGASAVGATVGTGGALAGEVAAGRGGRRYAYAAQNPAYFGRMFNFRPFANQSPQVEAALNAVAASGGPMDARDDLSDPVALITNPDLSRNNPDNPAHPAGATFMAQFLDHDITFDFTSRLGDPAPPEATPNSRTPALDLDSVYGRGPVADPQLYDAVDRAKLRVERARYEDVPRGADGRAILGDPRNDENLIISGLHCAFLLFHDNVVDLVRSQGSSDAFGDARRLTTWHYQWLVVNEFLPLFVGPSTVNQVLTGGRRYYTPGTGQAYIPVEFNSAAYRFGHSMVRPSYRANFTGNGGSPFFGFIFKADQDGRADPDDLRGGHRADRRFVGWETFFAFNGNVKHNKLIDTKISSPLFNLPISALARNNPPTSLPQRNLLRQLTWKLPSGQDLARLMGLAQLSAGDLAELRPYGHNLDRSTPLWYYILKEAEVIEGGLHLGPVGGRIVAEVVIGLLQCDPTSYLAANPSWQPTLPPGPSFRMTDFLTFAGVAGRR